MAMTWHNYAPWWWEGGLPTPDLYLNGGMVSIQTLEHGSIDEWETVRMARGFYITAKDLTDSQIRKGVYLEMAYHKASRWSSRKSGYTIPPSRINQTNLWDGKESRWGGMYFCPEADSFPYLVDFINHKKVVQHNEVIPAWEYLHHRLTCSNIVHRTVWWLDNSIRTVPHQRRSSANPSSWSNKWHSATFAPLYMKFRWVMRNDDDNGFIVWWWSDIVVVSETIHPYVPSGTDEDNNLTCTISPYANYKNIKATIRTRTP